MQKGENRLEKQLDIVKYLKNQIVFEAFTKTKLSKLELLLMKNHRSIVLDNNKSDSATNSDEEKEQL